MPLSWTTITMWKESPYQDEMKGNVPPISVCLPHMWDINYVFGLQNWCRTTDPDRQNRGRSSNLSFFTIYRFWQSCVSVLQVSHLILKNVFGSARPLISPGKCGNSFTTMFFRLMLWTDIMGTSCEIGLTWASQNPTDDKTTFDQVMAWCYQATSPSQSKSWPRFMPPYGITQPRCFHLIPNNQCLHITTCPTLHSCISQNMF